MRIILIFFLWFLICFPLFSNGQQIDPLAVSKAESRQQQKWVDSVYQSLSLYEKVGQLFMPMVFSEQDSSHYKLSLNLS